MNLVFLDYLVDFPREEPARISSVEWPDLKPTLLEFFEQSHPVRIDDQRVLPELEELQINDPDLALLPLFPISGEQGLRKIRFRLVYPTSSMPSKVEISWTTFPPDILTDLVDPPPLDLAAEEIRIAADRKQARHVREADEARLRPHARGRRGERGAGAWGVRRPGTKSRAATPGRAHRQPWLRPPE